MTTSSVQQALDLGHREFVAWVGSDPQYLNGVPEHLVQRVAYQLGRTCAKLSTIRMEAPL